MQTSPVGKQIPAWAASLILLLGSWTGGCQTRVVAEDQQFRVLFDGFQLKFVADAPTNTSIQELDTSALQNTYPSERTLVSGRVYSLRKTSNTSDEDLAIRILPERLAKIGARVTKAPQ